MALLKYEHTILSCSSITARKRSELNLESSIGNYEFAVVPKSHFTPDSEPLYSFHKAKVLHAIEPMVKDEEINANETSLDTSMGWL